MRRKIGIALLSLPIILVGGFFATSALLSPRSGGRQMAIKLDIPYPAVIAHRGASALAPEETKAAYLVALQIGVDYLELDLQRTKDGVLIALHDDTLGRTTNVAEVFPERKEQSVDHFTMAELEKLDAGSWFNRANPGHARASYVGLQIARLDEVIDIAEKGSPIPGLYIETKVPEKFPGIEKQLVEHLKARGWISKLGGPVPQKRLIFQSFEAESLIQLKKHAPGIARVYLISPNMKAERGFPALLARASELGSGIGPAGYYAFAWYTGPAHKAGLIVHPYTINKAWQMRLLRQSGVDGLFTDASHIAVPILKGRPEIDVEEALKAAGY